MHIITAVGNRQRRRHPGHTAADHQGRRLAAVLDLCGSAARQPPARRPCASIPAPCGWPDRRLSGWTRLHCSRRLTSSNRYGIQPGLPHRRAGTARRGCDCCTRHHHAVKLLGSRICDLDAVHALQGNRRNPPFRPLATSGQCAACCARAARSSASLNGIAARTDKHPDARRFVGDIALRRQIGSGQERPFARVGMRVQLVVEQAHHFRCCAAGVDDRFRDLFGRRKRAADKHARTRRLQRREFIRLAETVFVQLDVEQFRPMRCAESGGCKPVASTTASKRSSWRCPSGSA